ncbi:MAG: ABC transporter ATP-binding protein [Clostridia bacterium]|nr:ABC transporter ATP-binding protein [Clostridia bacterium]
MEILRAEHITKVYGKGETAIRALDDVSLSVESGEFVAVVGSSGSGKSTLIHILGSVDTPDSGKVYMNGQDVFAQSKDRLAIFRRRQVGIIYQFYNLLSRLTVEENILLPALLDGREIDRDYYNELLELLELKGREHAYPRQLSGGQQQRVAIGRTLITNPAVVLADEPTGNLDQKNTQEVMELFRLSNKKYEQTIILITHDEDIALQADRIVAIEYGRIVKNERIR